MGISCHRRWCLCCVADHFHVTFLKNKNFGTNFASPISSFLFKSEYDLTSSSTNALFFFKHKLKSKKLHVGVLQKVISHYHG